MKINNFLCGFNVPGFFISFFLFLRVHSQTQTGECEINKNTTVHYLTSLNCFKEFNYLQGSPLSNKYSQVKCVKIIYRLKDHTIFYSNSKIYRFHYDFCTTQLGYSNSLQYFNSDQYSSGAEREYLLANLNYYTSGNKYVLEFFADDKISAGNIILLFNKLKSTSYFGNRISLMMNSQEMMTKSASLKGTLPFTYPEDIYSQQKYQALNKEESYGYLHLISDYNTEKKTIKQTDIIIVKNVPQDIPLIAGILTDQFQTPLSHINVLSHNRKTPNASFKGIWESSLVDSLKGKLVHYVVKENSFILEPASIEKANAFWKRKNKSLPIVTLKINAEVSGLINIKNLDRKSVAVAGGKAANLGELAKIKIADQFLPVPEEAFAIPFYYYLQHIKKNNILDSINNLLSNDSIRKNYDLLDARLKAIRSVIKKAPIDTSLLHLVENRIRKTKYRAFRFRSSTNAEDIENFNGAGLYDSKTGILNDSAKTIEKAIKQVWASLWNTRAFQERENFEIDQHTVAMGILVHKSFGKESANGVAVTSHLYRDNYPAYTINVQKGEISVVFPPDSIICDQLIIGTRRLSNNNNSIIEYVTRSNVKPKGNVLTEKEIEQLKDYLTAIKYHYYKLPSLKDKGSYDNFSMDVEFKLDAVTRKVIIKQARPY